MLQDDDKAKERGHQRVFAPSYATSKGSCLHHVLQQSSTRNSVRCSVWPQGWNDTVNSPSLATPPHDRFFRIPLSSAVVLVHLSIDARIWKLISRRKCSNWKRTQNISKSTRSKGLKNAALPWANIASISAGLPIHCLAGHSENEILRPRTHLPQPGVYRYESSAKGPCNGFPLRSGLWVCNE